MWYKKAILFTLLITVVFLSSVWGGKFDGWQSYTSTSEVRYLTYFNDSLQVITSGGWLKVDPVTKGVSKLTNTDNLGTNDLCHVIKDNDDVIWIAGFGRLIKCENNEYTPYLFFDRDDELMTLYSIADDGDKLWVGTSLGLVLFSKEIDNGQIEDLYFRFGGLNPEPSVYDILLSGDTIWIATADGLAFADRSDPDLLKSFANWGTIKPTRYSSGSHDSVFTLAFFNNQIYMGTTEDIFKLELTDVDTNLVDIPTSDSVIVRDVEVHGDSLLIYTESGCFIYDGLSVEKISTPGIPDESFASGIIINETHWIGDRFSGLYFDSGPQFEKLDDGGPPGNNVTTLSVDIDGNIAGAFQRDGIALFEDDSWENIPINNISGGMRTILHDNMGNIWAGSWGGGLVMINNDTIIYYNESNSSLHGVSGASYYVVVVALDITSQYLFMANYLPSDENTVCWVDMNDHTNWGSFGLNDGLPAKFLGSIAATENVFVIGTPDKGIYYYYYGSDPADKSDDSVINLAEANSWLGSDDVRTVRFDDNGTLWAGTKFGLSRYDTGIDHFVNVNLPLGFGPDIYRLAFDKRGNIWMGSGNGLARYKAGTGEIDIFTTLNSGLADDNITGLVINPITSDLWVGTGGGVLRYASEIGPPVRDIENVSAFPNPFVIRGENEFLSFNYDGIATVRIYTVSGELIWEKDINIPWRGQNQQQQDVAPGVYLFMLTDSDGSVGKGKIFLVRE